MTVQSNSTIAVTMLSLNMLRQFFQPVRRKTKANRTLQLRHFSCTVSKLQVLARNFDCFIMLFVPRVTGLINHFDLVFFF